MPQVRLSGQLFRARRCDNPSAAPTQKGIVAGSGTRTEGRSTAGRLSEKLLASKLKSVVSTDPSKLKSPFDQRAPLAEKFAARRLKSTVSTVKSRFASP